jgi:hypothetical protein
MFTQGLMKCMGRVYAQGPIIAHLASLFAPILLHPLILNTFISRNEVSLHSLYDGRALFTSGRAPYHTDQSSGNGPHLQNREYGVILLRTIFKYLSWACQVLHYSKWVSLPSVTYLNSIKAKLNITFQCMFQSFLASTYSENDEFEHRAFVHADFHDFFPDILLLSNRISMILLWVWYFEDNFFVWLEVLTAVSMKMAVFWVVAPCRLVSRCYNPEDNHLHDLFETWFVLAVIT